VYNILDIKERSKNLAGVNLELAKNYLQNNNLFDAKLRYKIVLKIKPNNAEALCGLASIYFIEKRMKKSEEYFQKAIPFADKQMQDEIFHSINLIKTFKP
jgi:Tfp pilus assembly protein PilF